MVSPTEVTAWWFAMIGTALWYPCSSMPKRPPQAAEKKQKIYVTSGCVKPLVSVVTLPFLKVIYHDSMALPDHFHWICGGSHFETGCKESPLQGIHATFSIT